MNHGTNTKELPLAIGPFLREVEVNPDERSIERALKLALRPLPEAQRLTFFALAITAPLPHPVKAALWRVVRYSHFWWNVDALLQGDVMENPVVQRAFADAVAMRRWKIRQRLPGWEDAVSTLAPYARESLDVDDVPWTKCRVLASLLVFWEDDVLADFIPLRFADAVADFSDSRGNGILWYLTYREDQNAEGGFACPKTAKTLISLGANPYQQNELSLCWNDVARHFVR